MLILVNGLHLFGASKLGQTLDGEANSTAAPDADNVAFAHFGQLIAMPGSCGHVRKADKLLSVHVLWGLDANHVCIRDAAVLGLVAGVEVFK